MTGADAIVRCLELEEVSYVFGYPGVAICPFFDSLENTDIKSILVRTEQNAAHEANGYARISGKPGVCAVTSGPGATNVITGIATAFADSIPLIVITGQVESRLLGSDVFQEADICGASESFVKYSYTLRNAEEIPKVFKEAFHIAMTGRKGPVLIDIPIDVQKASLRKFQYPDDLKMRTYKPTVQGNPVQIKRLFQRLLSVKKPILCVGGGVHLAGASEKVRDFSHKFNIPVVSTMMGLGTMQDQDPLYFGMVGNNGRSYGNKAMNRAELIIMMGARVADRSISQPDLITENKTLVHIDVDPAEIGKNAGPEIPLVGDLSSVLDSLLHVEAELSYPDWMEELNGIKEETELLIEKKKREEASLFREEEIYKNELKSVVQMQIEADAILDKLSILETNLSKIEQYLKFTASKINLTAYQEGYWLDRKNELESLIDRYSNELREKKNSIEKLKRDNNKSLLKTAFYSGILDSVDNEVVTE